MNPYKAVNIKCRLTRLTDNNHTRTTSMEGVTDQPPTVKQRFSIINGDPLVKTGYTNRIIMTSEVQSIEHVWSDTIKFKTENTEYLYEELP